MTAPEPTGITDRTVELWTAGQHGDYNPEMAQSMTRQYNIASRAYPTSLLFVETHDYTRTDLEEMAKESKGRLMVVTREVTPWLPVA